MLHMGTNLKHPPLDFRKEKNTTTRREMEATRNIHGRRQYITIRKALYVIQVNSREVWVSSRMDS